MKFEEISSDGLKRTYKVEIAAKDIETQIQVELEGLKSKVDMKGFRPGHAPIALLEKQHGPAIRGQVLEQMVNAAAEKIVTDSKIKPAGDPAVDKVKYEEGSNLEFQLDVDILPEIKLPDLTRIKLDRLKAGADDRAVKKVIEGLLEQQKIFEDSPKGAKAKLGDAVVIDFIGRVGGKKFEGAEADDFQLELGSGSFIEGFEDQLVGKKAGDTAFVKVTFPENYNMKEVAGKAAEFEVTVKGVKVRKQGKADDAFAKALGFDHLKGLTESITKKIEDDNASLARALVKRKLLDHLAAEHTFEVPPRMVEREYQEIWERIKEDMLASGDLSAEDAKTLEEPKDAADRKDFRHIAERRVRLGLLLAEIGNVNNVTVNQEEINHQIMFEARRFPGQEQAVFDYYRKNDAAMKSARAPVYEDKVVDLILASAKVTEKDVTTDQLTAAYDAMETADDGAGQKPAKKAKKATASPAAGTVTKKAPSKKAAKKK